MTRLFMVAGELSGDQLAAWYLAKRRSLNADLLHVKAVGGEALQGAGAEIVRHFTSLNVVGITEIVRHIPRLLRIMHDIVEEIMRQQIDEVVLVDFPGFNLRLAKKLKARNPSLKITYLSPPQVWCWGRWRLKTLKRFIDQMVVIYPFEVAWYAEHGLKAVWLGNPVVDRVLPFKQQGVCRAPMVALLPGSRQREVDTLLPIMLAVAQKLVSQFPSVTFVLMRPSSIALDLIDGHLVAAHMRDHVIVVDDEIEKMRVLQQCVFALTKPGTVTLELALLGLPAIVMYKTSALTFFIAKRVVYISSMALPNLLTGQQVYPEFLQGDCTVEKLFSCARAWYEQELCHDVQVDQRRGALEHVAVLFR